MLYSIDTLRHEQFVLALPYAPWHIDMSLKEHAMPNIGERIKQLRVSRRLTQTALAARAGVPQSLISRLEDDTRHNTNTDVLKRLAQALGCTTDYLVGMHEEGTDHVV
jgi:DNA-binding Xre family transcriptional regulator